MDDLINNATQYIAVLFKDNADGHDLKHSMRVYKNAMEIAAAYPDADDMVIALAAILHDADDHKLFNTKDNANTRSFLKSQGISDEKTDQICEVINSVSFSKNKGRTPDTIEGCIVQDADRLDALGAIGIARTFAYGGKHNRSLEESVDHFYDKLFLLKEQMNTPEAKLVAEKRHQFLELYINELKNEIFVSMT